MSHSSISDELDKEHLERSRPKQQHLTETQEDLIESGDRPFTEKWDVEQQSDSGDVAREGRDRNGDEDREDGRDGEAEAGAAMSRVSSRPSVNNINSVPNGGLRAWLQVLSSFFVFFNTWGIVNAFGTYQTYYESSLLTNSTPSEISWIGSIQAFLLMLVGSIAGPIYDAGYAREVLAVGSILIVLGQMMLSLCNSYWQVLLAQGFSIGIGTGLIFVTGLAILSTYFSTRIATATGIAAAGSSIGGTLYPIIFYKLQPSIGFAWATRVLGFVALATLITANLAFKVRVKPTSRRKILDLPAWKEPPYLLYNLGAFLTFIGLYTPFFYIANYALEEKIMGPNLAFYIFAVLNAASTFGRILPNLIADKLGPFNIIVPCIFATGLLTLCLIAAHSTAAIMVIMAFYGFFSGTLVSLPGTIYVHLAGPHKRGLVGTRMGMGFAFVGIGILIGTPLSGAILKRYGYAATWGFGGAFTILGAIVTMVARFAQAGWVVRKIV